MYTPLSNISNLEEEMWWMTLQKCLWVCRNNHCVIITKSVARRRYPEPIFSTFHAGTLTDWTTEGNRVSYYFLAKSHQFCCADKATINTTSSSNSHYFSVNQIKIVFTIKGQVYLNTSSTELNCVKIWTNSI